MKFGRFFLVLSALFLSVPAWAQMPGLMGGDNKQPIEVTADQALEWHQKEKFYIARGNAKATRGDKTVYADELIALERDVVTNSETPPAEGETPATEIYQVHANGHVIITGPQQEIKGDKAVYDVDSDSSVVTGQKLSFKNKDDLVTARDRLEYWGLEKKAVAVGDAVAVRADRSVRGDTMVAFFVPGKNADGTEGDQLDRIEATGNVVIVAKSDVAQAASGVYYAASNKATLKGDVKIARGGSQLAGDAAEIDFTTGQSRLLGTGKRVSGLLVPKNGGSMPVSSAIAAPTPSQRPPVAEMEPKPAVQKSGGGLRLE